MDEIERAMNPTIDEAIKYLKGAIFTADMSQSTLRAIAINEMAIKALREQNRRVPDIVRCGECKHNQSGDMDCPHNYIEHHAMVLWDKPDDWFCADGERRESECKRDG